MTPEANLGKNDANEDFSLPEHKQIYANGFYTAVTPVDIIIGLSRNGQTTAVLNLSASLTKTLAYKLLGAVEDFEKQSGLKVPTLDEIYERLTKQDEVSSNEK
jgi:hypothetical protein